MPESKEPHALGVMTEAEIASQPELWNKAHSLGKLQHQGMPKEGESILIMGCGTSYYVAAAYASLRNLANLGESDAVIASDYRPGKRKYDRIIVISRSGTSLDLIEAIGRIPAGTLITAILGELNTPIQLLASDVVDFSFADEKSVVQTRFPTSLLVFFRAQLGQTDHELNGLVSALKHILSIPLLPKPTYQLVILGSHWASFLAEEGALKCRESVGMWVESYSTAEYRHGPISVASEGTLVFAMTTLSEQEVSAIKQTGASLHQCENDPLVELVYLQRHALQWARDAFRDSDTPRHLARSVI